MHLLSIYSVPILPTFWGQHCTVALLCKRRRWRSRGYSTCSRSQLLLEKPRFKPILLVSEDYAQVAVRALGYEKCFWWSPVSRQRSSRSLSGNTLQPNSPCTQEGGRSFDLSMIFCILPSVFTIWNSIFTCIYIWSMSFPLYAKLYDRKDRIELSWQSGLCLNMC